MAERNSSKTGSRRTTPQPVVETTRTTRATRSQSHEVSDHEGGKYAPKGRRGAKKAAAGSTETAAQTTTTKARRGRPPQGQPDLPTVNEDPGVVVGRFEEGEDGPQLPINTKSPGGASAFSGTTARTSRSAQELTENARDDVTILDALPHLLRESESLLDFLLPPQISSETIASVRLHSQNKASRTSHQLDRLRSVFQIQFEFCYRHAATETFASPSRAIPTLAGLPASSWRPDAVYHAANLAILASNTLSYPQKEGRQFLESIDVCFPKAFIKELSLADAVTSFQSTLQLAIDLRTQCAITALADYLDRPNFDADDVLAQVFFEEDKILKGWDFAGLRIGQLSKDSVALLLQRLEDIKSITDGMGNTAEDRRSSLEQLRANYGWDEFAVAVWKWTKDRKDEIKAELPELPVIERYVSALQEAVSQMQEAKGASGGNGDIVLDFDPQSEPSNGTAQQGYKPLPPSVRNRELRSERFNANSPKDRQNLKFLKDRALKKKVSKSTQPISRQKAPPSENDAQIASTAGPAVQAAAPGRNSEAQPVNEPIAEDDDWRPQPGDDDDEDDFQTQALNADHVLELRAQRDAESNKENQAESSQARGKRSLYDRQAGARKVPWHENSNSQESEVLEVSQDEGFQEPHHRTSAARHAHALQPTRKRIASEPVTTQHQSPAKRARFTDRASRAAENTEDDDAGPSQAPPRPSQTYELANTAARQITAMQPKRIQTRTPWSADETDRLMELITQFGTSWKLLKQEDVVMGILDNRDQVALKDKARNMKLDFLKTSKFLPPNFDKIPLSKLQIQKLRDCNIPYDPELGVREDAEVPDEY